MLRGHITPSQREPGVHPYTTDPALQKIGSRGVRRRLKGNVGQRREKRTETRRRGVSVSIPPESRRNPRRDPVPKKGQSPILLSRLWPVQYPWIKCSSTWTQTKQKVRMGSGSTRGLRPTFPPETRKTEYKHSFWKFRPLIDLYSHRLSFVSYTV